MWDSGKVKASAATGVKCGVDLPPLTSYGWTAQWWANSTSISNSTTSAATGSTPATPSPISGAEFVIGPVTEDDWEEAMWIGAGGQNDFRFSLTANSGSDVYMFVASPGGAVVLAGSGEGAAHVGDPVGVSAWTDFRKTVPYQGYLLPSVTDGGDASAQTELMSRILIGNGFWSPVYPLGGAFWGIPQGKSPVAKVLVVGARVEKVEGRRGAVVSDDPWLGTVTDVGLSDDDGWGAALSVPPNGAGALWRPVGANVALQVP
jgi:hypothetical protein